MMSEIGENEATIAGIEVNPVTTSDPQVRNTEERFTEVVEQFSDMAYGVALRMLRNADDAEDAVQEAFISAYRAFPSFKGQ